MGVADDLADLAQDVESGIYGKGSTFLAQELVEKDGPRRFFEKENGSVLALGCLLYTSDAADE